MWYVIFRISQLYIKSLSSKLVHISDLTLQSLLYSYNLTSQNSQQYCGLDLCYQISHIKYPISYLASQIWNMWFPMSSQILGPTSQITLLQSQISTHISRLISQISEQRYVISSIRWMILDFWSEISNIRKHNPHKTSFISDTRSQMSDFKTQTSHWIAHLRS